MRRKLLISGILGFILALPVIGQINGPINGIVVPGISPSSPSNAIYLNQAFNSTATFQPNASTASWGMYFANGVKSASASGHSLCEVGALSEYWVEWLQIGAVGDIQACSGYTQPVFSFQMQDNTAGDAGEFIMANSGNDGPSLGVNTSASISCRVTFGNPVHPTISQPCSYIDSENQLFGGANSFPLVLIFNSTIAEGFFGSNSSWFAVGNTTPVQWLQATSTGTSQATVTVGDTNSGSGVAVVNMASGGATFTLGTGTGACATTSTLVGEGQAGSFLCTGTAGASTIVINLPTSIKGNGWSCWGSDVTSGVAFAQSTVATNSCKLTGTIGTTSDKVVFGALAF